MNIYKSVSRWFSVMLVVMLLVMGVLPPQVKSFASPLFISIATFTVNSTLDQPDDLTMPHTCHTAAGTCTLRAAVMQANRAGSIADKVVINLPAGHYFLNAPASPADNDASGDLNLTTPTSGTLTAQIIGAGAATTIIDANSHDRVFHVHPGRAAEISGVTIQNGYVTGASGFGGGIYNEGLLTTSDVTIFGNHSAQGGGIYSVSDLSVSNSTINQNVSDGSGGGISNGSSLSVGDSTISHNSAALAGAGISNTGTLNLTNSTLSQNNVGFYGAAIYNGLTLDIRSSTLGGNTAGYDGGGIYNDGSLVLTNSTLSGNNTNRSGAGIYNDVGTVNVYNTSILFNDADMDSNGGLAGGVFNSDANGAVFNMRNTLLSGNTILNAPTYNECSGTLNSYGMNIISALTVSDVNGGCAVVTVSGTWAYLNNLNTLGPLQDNGGPTWTIALLPGSNAIDAGDPVQGCIGSDSLALADDQRGAARVAGVRCDIGAYELDPSFVTPTPTPTNTPIPTATPIASTVTFTSAGPQDGWVLESGEKTSKGDAVDSAAGTFNLGDDAAKKQYRGLLSFSTGAGLPDGATIIGVTLRVRKQHIVGGGNPLTTFQGFMLDIKIGPFGTKALQPGDFQAPASTTLGPFMPVPTGGWYNIELTGANAFINKLATGSGLTQIRLRFKLDDNNNAVANYLSLYSGNAPAAADRPQLVITYYVP